MNGRGEILSWGALWRVFFMLLFGTVIFIARDVFIALFLAIVIAAALDRPVSALEKKRVPRILGTLIIYLICILALASLIYSVVPAILAETSTLLHNFRSVSSKISNFINPETILEIDAGLRELTNFFFGATSNLIDISSKFLGGVIFTASVFVFSFYLTVGRDGVERFLITILPTSYENRALDLYARVRRKIGKWLMGQLILSAIVGTAVFLGLWILGVRYSLLLGFLAAIMELVPYVGPIFTGSLAVLIGLTTSAKLAVFILILFIIIQQLENHVFVPAVMSMTTALNPVIILVAILIGAKIFGIVGLILAVPIAVLLQEIIEDWSEAKQRARARQLDA